MPFKLNIKTAADAAAERAAAQAAQDVDDARRLLAETDHEIIKAMEAQMRGNPALSALIAERQAARATVTNGKSPK